MHVLTIDSDLPFTSPLGLPTKTVETLVVVDHIGAFLARSSRDTRRLVSKATGTDAKPLERALQSREGRQDRPVACLFQAAPGLQIGYVLAPSPSEALPLIRSVADTVGTTTIPDEMDPSSAATLMTWHEIGHLLVSPGAAEHDHYVRRLVEGWCDALGASACLHLHGDRQTVRAWGRMRDLLAAAERLRSDPHGLWYATGEVAREVLSQAPAAPPTIADAILLAGEAADAAAPTATAFRAAFAALQDATENRGDNCIRVLNRRMAEIRLDLVHSKGLTPADVARQVHDQITAGRRVRPPRADLCGGQVAFQGFQTATSSLTPVQA